MRSHSGEYASLVPADPWKFVCHKLRELMEEYEISLVHPVLVRGRPLQKSLGNHFIQSPGQDVDFAIRPPPRPCGGSLVSKCSLKELRKIRVLTEAGFKIWSGKVATELLHYLRIVLIDEIGALREANEEALPGEILQIAGQSSDDRSRPVPCLTGGSLPPKRSQEEVSE
jgi:hypothetical protein